jgi:hypothetical protein
MGNITIATLTSRPVVLGDERTDSRVFRGCVLYDEVINECSMEFDEVIFNQFKYSGS